MYTDPQASAMINSSANGNKTASLPAWAMITLKTKTTIPKPILPRIPVPPLRFSFIVFPPLAWTLRKLQGRRVTHWDDCCGKECLDDSGVLSLVPRNEHYVYRGYIWSTRAEDCRRSSARYCAIEPDRPGDCQRGEFRGRFRHHAVDSGGFI